MHGRLRRLGFGSAHFRLTKERCARTWKPTRCPPRPMCSWRWLWNTRSRRSHEEKTEVGTSSTSPSRVTLRRSQKRQGRESVERYNSQYEIGPGAGKTDRVSTRAKPG